MGSDGGYLVDTTKYSVSYQDQEDIDDNQMVFVGWSIMPITEPGAPLDDYGESVDPVAAEIEVHDTVHLYPVFRSVKWIRYESGPSGSGATYFSDTPYYDGTGPESLPGTVVHDGYPAMTRDPDKDGVNYVFEGWFARKVETETGETYSVPIADAQGSLIADASSDGISVVRVPAVGTPGDPGYIQEHYSRIIIRTCYGEIK